MKFFTVSRQTRAKTLVSREKRVHALLTTCLTVIATVSVAACSSGHGGGGGDGQHQRPDQAQSSPTPAPYNYNANGPGQLDAGSGQSQQESDKADSQKGDEVQFSDGSDASPTTIAPVMTPSARAKGGRRTGTRRLNQAGVTPTQSSRQPWPASGEMQDSNGTPLYYGSASSDHLRAKIEAIAPSSRGDLNWAAELSKGMVYFTPQTREVEVDVLQTRAAGDQYKIILRGYLGRDGRAVLPDSGSNISGALECLDVNGGCETAHVKILNTGFSRAREAHMIIRTTNSKLRTTGKGFDISHNHEYDWFLNILVNTATLKSDVGYVQRLVVETSETMHGVSNVAVTMDILNRDRVEYLDFNGPLVRYSESDAVNSAMVQTTQNPAGMQQQIANTLNDIRLVSNNGRGGLAVALTVRAGNAGSVEDVLTLQLDRIENAIKAPTSL